MPFSCQINEAANVIYENVDPEANIIFGALVDPEAKSELSLAGRASFCAFFFLALWLFL